jgi:hypothetical protein
MSHNRETKIMNNPDIDTFYNGRRGHARVDTTENISLKIVFSSENPALLGKMVNGAALDVSANGLRISLNQAVKLDSVLDIWITDKELNRKYFLTGNVRWCLESGKPGDFQIGLILRERSDTVTDLRSWREAFK